MKKLSDYGYNVYSQFGEDGIIEEIFRHRVPPMDHVCVEFGAYDGVSQSNTAALWKDGWRTLLIEGDPERYELLETATADEEFVVAVQAYVEPEGPNSIDAILGDIGEIDFMSIDIDGSDYAIWDRMKCQPSVVVIEYNQTIPPHIELFHPDFGASLRSLIHLGQCRGYTFAGLTHCNAFFVLDKYASHFKDLETDPAVLLPPEQFTYVISNQYGYVTTVGAVPGWGMHRVYPGNLHGVATSPVSDPMSLSKGYVKMYGDEVQYLDLVTWNYNIAVPTDGASRSLAERMKDGVPVILCAIDHVSDMAEVAWVPELARKHGYEYRVDNTTLIVLIKSQ